MLRWASGVALLALTPKCLVCVAAYLGIGALLGLKVPELCGPSPSGVAVWVWPVVGVSALAVTVLVWRRRGHRHIANPRTPNL